MTDSPLLTVQNLSRSSRSGKALLSEISFSVFAGDRWAVTGDSGAGKTLLLRALALLDSSAGTICWRGSALLPAGLPEYRSQVIYLAQSTPVVEGTVVDNLKFPYQLNLHADKQWSRTQAEEWCRRLGKAEGFLDQNSADLSGGEKQLVALLRVLPLGAHLLLLDEATSALDRATELKFEQLIDEWLTERSADRAVVWVSHDEAQRKRVSSQVLHLVNGRMVEGGP